MIEELTNSFNTQEIELDNNYGQMQFRLNQDNTLEATGIKYDQYIYDTNTIGDVRFNLNGYWQNNKFYGLAEVYSKNCRNSLTGEFINYDLYYQIDGTISSHSNDRLSLDINSVELINSMTDVIEV